MLNIVDLTVKKENKEILKNLNLTISPGECHVIMGPNGEGKSTLGKVVAGSPEYTEKSGQILFQNENILQSDPSEIAAKGIFLGFQYPIEIKGLNNLYFLRASLNSIRKYQNLPEINGPEFLKLARTVYSDLGFSKELIERQLNYGFSGGEKKKNEIFQMMILLPKLAILDEIDSGLDIDSLIQVSAAINKFRNKNNSLLMITHYKRILEYVKPDYVHVLKDGKIIETGNIELVDKLEKKGYR